MKPGKQNISSSQDKVVRRERESEGFEGKSRGMDARFVMTLVKEVETDVPATVPAAWARVRQQAGKDFG